MDLPIVYPVFLECEVIFFTTALLKFCCQISPAPSGRASPDLTPGRPKRDENENGP